LKPNITRALIPESNQIDRQQRNLLTTSILICSLALYPLFFRLNILESNFALFDILLMVTPYAWAYLFAVCALLSLDVYVERRCGLLHVLVAALLVSMLYTVSQYPAIVNVDTFLHGSSTNVVLAYRWGTYPQAYVYPTWFPGAFDLWAALALTSGLNVINSGLVLISAVLVSSVAMLYLLGRKIIGDQWAGVAPILYLIADAFHYRWSGREHFSPQTLGFLLFLMVLYLLVISQSRGFDRTSRIKLKLLLTLAICTVIVSHPITAMFLWFTLIAILLLQKITKAAMGVDWITISLLSTTWIGWWFLVAGSSFGQAFSVLLGSLESSLGKAKIATLTSVQDPLPLVGTMLRQYYFKPLLVVVGASAVVAILLNRRAKITLFFAGIALGTAAASGLELLTPNMAVFAQLSEVLAFSLLPLSYLAVRLFMKNQRAFKAIAILLPLLIFPSFLVMFTYSTEYAEISHSWQVNSYQFLTISGPPLIGGTGQCSIGLDTYSNYGYQFFDVTYNPTEFSDLTMVNFTQWLPNHPTFFSNPVILRSFEQDVTDNYIIRSFQQRQQLWNQVDSNLTIDPARDRIFDNSYVQLYVAPVC